MNANTKLSSFGSELLLLRLPCLVPLAALALDVGMATIVASLLFFLPASWKSGVLEGSDEAFTVISSVHMDRCVTVTVKGLTISDVIGDITFRMA